VGEHISEALHTDKLTSPSGKVNETMAKLYLSFLSSHKPLLL